MIKSFTVFLLISVWFSGLFARENKQESIKADSLNASNIIPKISATRCSNSEIIIDGKLDEHAWKLAGECNNFVEISPGDNIKCEVETKMLITYDDDNLYLGFICYDNDMSKLRANMCDRDKIWNDDYVGVIIDTYRNNQKGYEFFCNPYGIQGDATWTPTGENDSYDLVFNSDAKIYKDRWTLEIAIPFKSIRFPSKPNQEWGLHIIRTRPRENRTQMSWAVISRDNPSFLGQAGILTGINNVKSSKNLEILPYVIGSQNGYKQDINNPNSNFINDKLKGDFGIGLRYGFTSNLSGEIVYNPDFSQVESDAAQVDVNTNSALFYSEKRPFFLEGNDFFTTYVNTVYTRMINKPLFAAKLLGKVGGFDVGYIGAYDKKTQFILPYDYGSNFALFDSLESFSNALRIRKSLKGDSYIGLIATDREVKKGYNRVLSFDGSLNFKNYYYFNWQVSGFSTKEINDSALYTDPSTIGEGKQDLTFNGQKFGAIGGFLSLQRQTRSWYNDLQYYDNPPETRRDLGFVNSVNFRQLSTSSSYTYYPASGFFVKLNPSETAYIKYKYDGSVKERVFYPNFFVQCKDLIDFSAGFLVVNDEDYKNIMLKGVHRGWINFNINTTNAVKGGGNFEIGKYIVRFGDPFVGYGVNLSLWLDLRLFGRLLMENTYTYSELSTSNHSEKLFAGYIIRDKASFQFTKNFFLRLVTQYDTFQKILEIDPLFSYKWNPFTIFYVGSTNSITDYGVAGDHPRFVNTGRQFFAKFQYLFRL
jgi:hypothetical protein